MSFISWTYCLFLLITAVLFYVLPGAERKKKILVLASCLFVCLFHWVSFLFLAVFSVGNYFLLRKLAATVDMGARRRIYNVALCINIATLLLYKIVLALNGHWGLSQLGPVQTVGVILGLSFYGLQQIGYLVEVYQKNIPFEDSFTDYFLPLAFFPKVAEGPIVKLNQDTGLRKLLGVTNWEANISYGIQRILLGLFKKIALADRLAPFVAQTFDEHNNISGLHIYIGAILFTIQMYLDFSGFIDIALGSARIFGVQLPENFNLPLRAVSIVDFWRRWHMSLINWLTTYVFYPISYRYRKMKGKGLLLAVIATFLISAAWHGLMVTFLFWGMCHIVYLVLEHRFFPKASNATGTTVWWKKTVQVILVLHLVSFANIFFRSGSIADVAQLFTDFGRLPFWLPEGISFKTWLVNGGQDIEMEFNYRMSITLCLLFLLFERRISAFAFSERYRIGYVTVVLVFLVVFGYFSGGENFVYNNF